MIVRSEKLLQNRMSSPKGLLFTRDRVKPTPTGLGEGNTEDCQTHKAMFTLAGKGPALSEEDIVTET